MKKDIKESRKWVSELCRDFGIALVAGSIALSYITITYWYYLITGMIFLFSSIYFKRITEKKVKKLITILSIIPTSIFTLAGIFFLINGEILPFVFLVILIIIFYILPRKVGL